MGTPPRRRRDVPLTSWVYPIEPQNRLLLVEAPTRFELADEQPVLGASGRGISEAFPLDGARSIYGATKLASELLVEEYRATYGLRTVVNRCGVLAGPWQMGKVDQGVFTLWVLAHLFERPLSYIGYGGLGKQVRDVLHVRDCSDLVALELGRMDELSGSVFNVGGGRAKSLSLQETTELCEKLTKKKVPIAKVTENRFADVPVYLTDTTKVTSRTGWTPQVGPEALLGEIAAWAYDHPRGVGGGARLSPGRAASMRLRDGFHAALGLVGLRIARTGKGALGFATRHSALLGDRLGHPHVFVPTEEDRHLWLRQLGIRTVLDIGAHAGGFATIIRGILPDAQIISFEPLEETFRELEALAAENPRHRALKLALGDAPGRVPMHKNEFSPASSLLAVGDGMRELMPFAAKSEQELVELKRWTVLLARSSSKSLCS